ncbi:MAG: hypothetical protein HEQ13_15185 [Dolichospermum sp. DEX189]|uniref:hypothetical protein n=1 Tax=Aphanizomenon flos-aquae TaxID=1176 RepID=UPI0013629657|nr:hypothetical protein [Aphanizomenon flos-aquae]MBO1070625.1 hypothetical protein [Dolichospermum sp. DEX189]QSV70970.1 MAG: hypothetical protein HEQ20_09670 [Aphanizomenon flos-aquae KM1D3_PB]
MSVENCRYGKAKGKRQEARVKRVWAILHFFTQFSFIVFTYLCQKLILTDDRKRVMLLVFRNKEYKKHGT